MPNKLYIGCFSADLENNDSVTFQVLVSAKDLEDAEPKFEQRITELVEQSDLFDGIDDVFLDGIVEAPLDLSTPMLVNFRKVVNLAQPAETLMNFAPDQSVEGLSQYTPPEDEPSEPFLSFETEE